MSRATGVGSWPDTDVRQALSAVRDLLSEDGLPYLPELPARGPGADMIGRGAGLLADLKVDLQPMGWRFVDRAGRDSHRTSALLREDLDELAEAFDGYDGDLKVQIAGPWTLASSIWLHRGERSVVDVGATRDLIASLAEGLSVHLGELARLVPKANLVVQIDEPGLPSVLSGELPTASGFGRIRAIDPTVAAEGLRDVVAAAGDRHTVVHCCAPDVPLVLLRNTGVKAVSLDTTLLSPKGWESVAATVESGVELWAGGVPTDETRAKVTEVIDPLVQAWRRVGLPLADLSNVTLTPACGLAGLSPSGARSVQRLAVDAARALTETAGS
ncbi:MAG: uroporphyrinogen decarboxylase/cobalamine-independent methonine synthase family protein [Dermatophilaceae bacterium]